ncbi:MAG: InlB B-repeat-containing protein, partial [Clostridia bacterium]|nr:InlB B-repeat-containing protein [Clostridia bacterium]
MTKRGKLALLLVLVMLLSFAFVSCTTANVPDIPVYFINNDDVYATINIGAGGVPSFPEPPEKSGYVFDGWYFDEGTWKDVCKISNLLNM